jgi:dolichol kinase
MNIVWMILAASLAFFCARSILIWGFLGYAVGWPVLIILPLLGVKVKRWEERLATLDSINEKLKEKAESQKPEGYQEFDNVDDLFKQLEKK